MVADAAAIDAAMMGWYRDGDQTARAALDDWLASPLDPRQAMADQDFVQSLMGG